MTTIQSIMLSVCFGAVVGAFIAEVVLIIQWKIADHREKKRKEKESSAQDAE